MNRRFRWALLAILTVAVGPVRAQQVPSLEPVRSQPPVGSTESVTGQVAQGWACLARQDLACAADLATRAVTESPRGAAGAALAVEVELARGGPRAALAFYERWLGNRVEEPVLLRRLAVAALEQAVGQSADGASQFRGTVALLDAGDPTARARLAAEAAKGGLAEMRVLASRGDAAAVKALAASVEGGAPNAVAAIQALGLSRNVQAAPALIARLSDPRPEVRGAAAEALGSVEGQNAAARLRLLLKDPSGYVRSSAASALYRLQDPAGAPVLLSLAASESVYSKLVAAEAMQSQPDAAWQGLVVALTRAGEPDVRLAAARLAARFDPALAAATLRALTDDTNAAIREEAARSLARDVRGDLKALRSLMSHHDPLTRLEAADAIVKETN
jgi:HEAT repeats